MRAGKRILSFAMKLRVRPEISALLSAEHLAKTFDMTRQLGNVDEIFSRVLDTKDMDTKDKDRKTRSTSMSEWRGPEH